MPQPLETSPPDSSPSARRGKTSLPGLRPATRASESLPLSALLEHLQPAARPKTSAPVAETPPPAPAGNEVWDGVERREHPRYQSAAMVTVVPVHMTAPDSQRPGETPQPRQFQGKLIDISRSGVAFLLPQPLPADLRVYLRISNYRINENLDTVGDVLRATPVDSLFYKIVCTFGYLLPEGQVSSIRKHLGDAWLV